MKTKYNKLSGWQNVGQWIWIALMGMLLTLLLSGCFVGDSGDEPSAEIDAGQLAGPQNYVPNWDENPVAYLPEAEMIGQRNGYAHNWDDNPVAYIPEGEVIGRPARYIHNWDDNPVAYIPEAEVLRDR